jgi:hypothetical protein
MALKDLSRESEVKVVAVTDDNLGKGVGGDDSGCAIDAAIQTADFL